MRPPLALPRSVWPRELHDADRPSATAQWTTLGRALELQRPAGERIVTDRYAPVFLSAPGRGTLTALRAGGGAVRLAERTALASVATSALCRHRFIDEHLLAALPDVEQVLVLGAGYDSRAYRFARAIATRPVYEVDLPPLSRHKADLVAARPDVFDEGHVTSIEIDFRTQSLDEQLRRSRFTPGAATFVVWEGVSMYLTSEAVAGTLAMLADLCGPRSSIAMDFWQHVAGRRPYDHVRRVGERSLRLIGEPLTNAVDSDAVPDVFAEAGFELVDLAGAQRMTARYATGGRHCDEGMYVTAAVRR